MDAKLKIAHLQMIQGVINRMAGNSFALKGWSVGIISALFALATVQTTSEVKTLLVALAYFPALAFWQLDGFFLRQERLFRHLYDDTRQKDDTTIDFSMDTSPFAKNEQSLFGVSLSSTLRMFHGMVVAVISLVLGLVWLA